MKTPEGQAILKRLRYLLDGADGETMTTVFSPATHAYMGGGYNSTTVKKPGVFTIGHAAGYGLLYQLTGDKKYAEYGRQCFERSLAGTRDRDDATASEVLAVHSAPVRRWVGMPSDSISVTMVGTERLARSSAARSPNTPKEVLRASKKRNRHLKH